MHTMSSRPAIDPPTGARAMALFTESKDCLTQRTDRLFAGLKIFEWLAGIAGALWISPKT
jgi:two-component system sensor histidine kinase/response regulator